MSRLPFWTEKLAQVFHDPFLKAWCQGNTAKELARWLGGMIEGDIDQAWWERFAQDKVAMLLSQRLLGSELVFPGKGCLWKESRVMAEALEVGLRVAWLMADLAATGADRPVLGTGNQVNVRLWDPGRDHVSVTHPLAAAPLKVPAPATLEALKEKLQPALELLDIYRSETANLSGEDRHRLAFLYTWRRLPEDLAGKDGLFWPLQPADTRCPDHSIWDHLRMCSALAFIPKSEAADERLRQANPDRRPWLLSMWVGPVGEYVGLARTGRDLWTGSTMLAELAWAMIEPLADELGPDAVIYPDLRANLRADRWLNERNTGILGESPGGSRASLIPNRFVAVVPEDRLNDLPRTCRQAVETRWAEMAQAVHSYLAETGRLEPGAWEAIFQEQAQAPPVVRWAAVPWEWDGFSSKTRKIKRDDITLPPAFPFERDPPEPPQPIEEIEEKRKLRFQGWIDDRVYTHYQAARWTFLQTHPGYLLGQRGFDYALIHHMLLAVLGARKLLGDIRNERPEPGEKCTLCGARQALANETMGPVGLQRRAARELWQNLDPEGLGSERLCGPCAVRRYLSDSRDAIRQNWESTIHSQEGGGSHRVPFPSSGTIAGQEWLVALCEAYGKDPGLRRAVSEFVKAFRKSGIKRTQFAGALPRLRRRLQVGLPDELRELLEIDVQYLDPAHWDRLEGLVVDASVAEQVRRAAGGIEEAMGRPGKHMAVLVLDGDRMGELLLGTPQRIRARWRDVLHPDAVDQIKRDPKNGVPPAWKRAWRSTLEATRLMGPSLHAFVSRALRHFSNRVLPWVVEREFGGRLIYAGGDDALVLCPAEDALPMLTRLDELFTAPWVLDRHPHESPWVPREPEDVLYEVGSKAARSRFEVLGSGDDEKALALASGRVFPMLGPGSSFSAGAAFGHCKTSLRVLRTEAKEMMNTAKSRGKRRAGLTWYTRSGAKVRIVAPLDPDQAGSVENIQALALAFKRNALPGRLPYKLRELAPLARASLTPPPSEHERIRGFFQGLVRSALETDTDLVTGIADAWWSELQRNDPLGPEAGHGVGFLLLARALSRRVSIDEGSEAGAEEV